jgi:hypothetical protein
MDFLRDLAKPGVITGLLRNVLSVLRTRFPAFVGSNALYVPRPPCGVCSPISQRVYTACTFCVRWVLMVD